MNISYANSSNTEGSKIPSLLYEISLLCIMASIVLTTLIGNFLVITAILTTKSLKTVTNSFILSLAVADTLVAIFVLPLSIYMVIFDNWIFGNLLCDLWISCDVGLCTASILNLCCISLDRYFAITRPLKYSRQRSPKLAKIMITVVWIGSFLITCPPIFGWKDTNRKPNTCTLNLLLSYRIYSSLGSFFLPCFIMIFVYLRIFKVIHDREKYLKKSSTSATTFSFLNKEKSKKVSEAELSDEKRSFGNVVKKFRRKSDMDLIKGYNVSKKASNASLVNYKAKNSLTKLSSPSQLVGEKLAGTPSCRYKTPSVGSFKYPENRPKSGNQEQMRLLKESKAAKTLAIVVGGFILSWLPFFIMYVLEAVLPAGSITKALCDWITWLGYVNSAINPFIYAFCSRQFRSAFYRISFGNLKSTSHASSFKYQNNLYFLSNNFYKINQLNGNFSNSNQSFPMVTMGNKNRNSRIENF